MFPEMLLVNAANVKLRASDVSTEVAGKTFVNPKLMAVGGVRFAGAIGPDVKVGLLEVEKEMLVWPIVPLMVPTNDAPLRKLVGPFMIVKEPVTGSWKKLPVMQAPHEMAPVVDIESVRVALNGVPPFA